MSGEPRNPEERRAPSPAAMGDHAGSPMRIERISERADRPHADLTPRHTVHPSLHDTLLLNYATNANLSLPSAHFSVNFAGLLAKANPTPTPIATLAQSCLIPLPFFSR